jgi:predicted PurR-regulated permease PerM
VATPPYLWTFRRIIWATLVFVFVALGFWLLFRFHQVIFILFIAIVIGTVFRPVVTWLNRLGLPRNIAGILAYFILLALLFSFIFLLFPLIFEQGSTLVAAIPSYYQSLREEMANYSNPFIIRLSEVLPTMLPGLQPTPQTGQQMLDFAGLAAGYLASVANAIFLTITVLLLAFHWTLDGPYTIQSLLSLAPKSQRINFTQLISEMEIKVGSYIAGQGLLCLIIFFMSLVTYLIIGLPNALVLAIIAGVMEAVPYIGPLLGAIPAGLIALSINPSRLIWVIVASIVIQQLENNFLVPRVMRKAVGINPFVSLLAIFAFTSLFGIAGTLMAIPIAAIIQLLLNRFVFYPATLESAVSTKRDHASRLRYLAQDLAQDLRKQARINKTGSDLTVKQIDQVMDEIEAITTDLDTLLERVQMKGVE